MWRRRGSLSHPGAAAPNDKFRGSHLWQTLSMAMHELPHGLPLVQCGPLVSCPFGAGNSCYIMPWLGFGLLDMARDVAAFNLPARLG